MKSIVYLCCPVQSEAGWAFLTAVTTFVKGDWDENANRRLLPARQAGFSGQHHCPHLRGNAQSWELGGELRRIA